MLKNKLTTNHNNRQAYNWLVYDSTDEFLLKFQSLISGVVMDLGCGNKPYEEYYQELGSQYIGVDWADTLHNLKADIVADLNKPVPQINSSSADTIISISVMEHLNNPRNFLTESFRILKPQGNFILQVPFQWRIHEAPFDYFRFTKYGLEFLLKEAGFKNITVHPSTGFFSSVILKCNYFSLRLIRGPKALKFLVRAFLSVFWFVGQKLAPVLDRLDKQKEAETQGYWVTATK